MQYRDPYYQSETEKFFAGWNAVGEDVAKVLWPLLLIAFWGFVAFMAAGLIFLVATAGNDDVQPNPALDQCYQQTRAQYDRTLDEPAWHAAQNECDRKFG